MRLFLLLGWACSGCGLVLGADDDVRTARRDATPDVVEAPADAVEDTRPEVTSDAGTAAPNLLAFNAGAGFAAVTTLSTDGTISPLVETKLDRDLDDVVGVPPNHAIFFNRTTGRRVLGTVEASRSLSMTPLPSTAGWSRAVAIAPGRVLWYRKADGAVHIDDLVSGALSTVYDRPLGGADDPQFVGHDIAFSTRGGRISLYTADGGMWTGRLSSTTNTLVGMHSNRATSGWTHFAPYATSNMFAYMAHGTDPGLLILERDAYGIANIGVWRNQPWPERDFDAFVSTRATMLWYRRVDGRTRIAHIQPDDDFNLQLVELTANTVPLGAGWTSVAVLE